MTKKKFLVAFPWISGMVLVNGEFQEVLAHDSVHRWNLKLTRTDLYFRQPPSYDVPEYIDFYKTIIAGFPSGDKRLTFVQMEALTGWAAKDEWDFQHLGMSNHPFIKANYPHHGK